MSATILKRCASPPYPLPRAPLEPCAPEASTPRSTSYACGMSPCGIDGFGQWEVELLFLWKSLRVPLGVKASVVGI